MSSEAAFFWGALIVGGITFVAVAGALLVRRRVTVEVLEHTMRLPASSMR